MRTRTPDSAIRFLVVAGGTLVALVLSWTTVAAPPTHITSEVASISDVTAEVHSLLTSIEQALSSEESYKDRRIQVKRSALQIQILGQALSDHDEPSDGKKSASSLQQGATELSTAGSLDAARQAVRRIRESLDGNISNLPVVAGDWGKIASTGTLMGLMKERAELIRKGLRRPRDPAVDSRHAMMISLMILAVHDDTRAVKSPVDKQIWQAACLELQSHFSQASTALRKMETAAAAEHFRLGMETCDRCHEKFKP